MQERVLGFFRDLSNKWLALEKSQRYRIIAIIVVLLTALGASIYFLVKPKMVVLMSGLDVFSVGEITKTLDDAKIKNRVVRNTTAVEVDQNDLSSAQIVLSEKNVPSSGSGSFTHQDALNFSGMGTTETIKLQNFKKVRESDLANSLKQFPGVKQATVNLVIPETENYFLKENATSTAGITLDLDKSFDKNQATAIARYISRSVQGLSMENIEIIDTNGNVLYSGIINTSEGYISGNYDLELQRKKEIETKVKGMLSRLYDEVNPSANVVLDWNKQVQQSETYRSAIPEGNTGLISSQTNESRSVTNSNPATEPGVAANDQITNYQMDNGTASSATEKKDTTNYLYDVTQDQVEKSVGDIDSARTSLSIIVYSNKNYNQDYLTKNNLLNGMTWEQFQDSVRAPVLLTIDQNVIDAVKAGFGIDNVVIVGYEVPVFYDAVVKPLAIEQIVIFAILALLILLLSIGLIRSQQKEEITEIEPELSVEDLLVSTQMEEQREAEAEKLQDIEVGIDSEIKRQIEKFVDEKPEAVAQLLRNWLNDEWE